MDNHKENITNLLEHFKVRPSYASVNTIYAILKGNGYKNIPKLETSDNIVTNESIKNYCNQIEKLMNTEIIQEDKKKNVSKEVYIFPESSMLPKNVYIFEKTDEEKLEDNYVEDDLTSLSESENSINSEIEEQEEGYQIYEDDSDQFSE
jgi:hypothetical protein